MTESAAPAPSATTGRARHRREAQIAEVLARHGLRHLLAVSGLYRFASFGREVLGIRPPEAPYAPPRDLRLALEELGPTFIKVGQLFSTRADLLAPEFRAELAKLQDEVPPFPGEVAQDVIEHELHTGADKAFASFDLEPLAAGSIGQAHAATLDDGTEVVVKIRRPGVVEQIEQDLEILRNCAAHATRRWQAAADIDAVGLAEEFGQIIRAELDYLREGRNAETFAANFANDPDVQIPQVYWETTTSRIITLERIRGIKVTELSALDSAGVDRQELAERATLIAARMVFEHGFFHGDPHPGNLFIQPSGRVGIIDFGIVGSLNDRLREELGKLLIGVMREDPERLAASLVNLGASAATVDRRRLREDLAKLLARYAGRGAGEIELSAAMSDLQDVARSHRLRLPRDLALLAKVVTMDEGMTAELAPGFQIAEALAPYARRQLLAQVSPAVLIRRLEQFGIDAAELATDFPGQLRRVLDVLGSGSLEFHLRAGELEPLVARAERLGNRIVVSVLGAAIIDGLAELAAADRVHLRARPKPAARARVGAAGALAAYTALRRVRARR
jgi:ubiquinone biosynthesis protein